MPKSKIRSLALRHNKGFLCFSMVLALTLLAYAIIWMSYPYNVLVALSGTAVLVIALYLFSSFILDEGHSRQYKDFEDVYPVTCEGLAMTDLRVNGAFGKIAIDGREYKARPDAEAFIRKGTIVKAIRKDHDVLIVIPDYVYNSDSSSEIYKMKQYLSLAMAMITCFFFFTPATAQTRFMVMSDMHVMDRSLFQDGGCFDGYRDSEPKLVEKSQDLFDRAVARVLEERPDILLIPGDLTKDGETVSHEYVAGRLSELTTAGIQVFVVPGNHDIDNPGAYSYSGASRSKVSSVSEGEFRSLYAGCGYADAVMSEGMSYMAYPGSNLAVIALDSRKPDTESNHYSEGGLTEQTLAWAEQAARRARQDGRVIIGMMHHPVMEHFDDHAYLAPTYIANQSAGYPALSSVQQRLAAAGIGVMFTGHYHLQSIQHETTAGGELWDVMTGSLSSYPMPMRSGTISTDGTLSVTSDLSIATAEEKELGKLRNRNTTRGMFYVLAGKMEQKLSSYASMLSMLGIKTTAGEIAPIMETVMMESYNHLINELSAGDEDQNYPQGGIDGCVNAYDTFLRTFFGKSYALAESMMGDMMSEYRNRMEKMVTSVFRNYKGEESNVIADNDNDALSTKEQAASVTVTAHSADGHTWYATFYHPTASYIVPDGTVAYKASVAGEEVLLSSVGAVIPKGEPVVLKSRLSHITMERSGIERPLSPDNELHGSDRTASTPSGTYILSLGKDGVCFYPHGGERIEAGKAYLTR